MRLLPKFTLIFLLVYGSGLLLAAYFAKQFLSDNARQQVLAQARFMMETATATRKYTTEHIQPIIEPSDFNFFPEQIPSFSAITNIGYLRKAYPDYSYREASLNPTNLADRALDWEGEIILGFQNDAGRKESDGVREGSDGRKVWLARPIRAPEKCLVCHSTPDRAPAAMVARYGPNNGFRWKADDIIAAQIVQVPTRVPEEIADKAFRTLMTYLGLVGLATLVILNVALNAFVVRPVARLSQLADRISKGDLETTDLPLKGSDEIAELASSFNRMKLSLAKALKMLEGE